MIRRCGFMVTARQCVKFTPFQCEHELTIEEAAPPRAVRLQPHVVVPGAHLSK